jgi:hypothetical protein
MIRTSSILPTAGYSTHNQEIFEKSAPLSSSYNSRQLFANNFLSKSVSYEAMIFFVLFGLSSLVTGQEEGSDDPTVLE